MAALQDLAWILEALPAGVWVGKVPDGSVAFANPAFERIMGMGAVEEVDIEGAPGTYGIFDRNGKPFPVERLPFSVVVTSGEPCVVDDIVIHRPDGKRAHIRAYGYPVYDTDKDMSHVVVAFFDISREVTAETERKQTQMHLAFAVDHAPIAIWAADKQGTILLSEGAGLASLGVKSGELVGMNIFDLYKEHPNIPGYIRRCLQGESFQYTTNVGDAAYDTWVTPVRDSNGEVVGMTGLSHDVSELRHLQSTVIQNDRVIALGTLAASVAHEINNPLTYMLAHAQRLHKATERLTALAEKIDGPESKQLAEIANSMRDMVEPLRTGTERISAITRDLRTFSRSDSGDAMFVDMRAATESVLQLVRKELEGRGALHLDLQDTAPIRGNQARLVQVILNLVVNAMQALAEGDPAKNRIAISTRNEGDQVLVEVEDSGAGVPVELRERIFEPFVSTKEIGEGTGLGLFVSRNIVRDFGGEISLDSRDGGGAVFRVSFPKATVAERRDPASERNTLMSPAATGASIFVIDDEARVADVLCASLRVAGYRAEREQDPERALQRLTQTGEAFDLIFCDLMMRGLTGMDLARALKSRSPAVLERVVFMTGGAFTPQAQKFLQANIAQCVEKPFDVVAEAERRLSRSRKSGL
jgi:PAS domain S-box-containing protein